MQRFLISVNVDAVDSQDSASLSLKEATYLSQILLTANPNSIPRIKQLLETELASCSVTVDCTALQAPEDVVDLLNSGADRVFLRADQITQIQSDVSSDGILERVVFSPAEGLYQGNLSDVVGSIETNAGLLVQDHKLRIHARNYSSALVESSGEKGHDFVPTVYVSIKGTEKPDWSRIQSLLKAGYIPIIPSSILTTSTQSRDLIPASNLITATLVTDRPDGLFTTVVMDENSICLGLVYSSAESIAASLETGKGVYKSRKRSGLWHKGATSGDTQTLLSIDADCDSDALVYRVTQEGDGFCHLKSQTCFGELSGVAKLDRTLQKRKQSAPEGSYTARLFNDPQLLKAKIMEEASELVEASSKAEIAAEAADLFYFALARCIAGGVTLSDVGRNLDLKAKKTSRRKGDAKAKWAEKFGVETNGEKTGNGQPSNETLKEAASVPKTKSDPAGTIDGRIAMKRIDATKSSSADIEAALQRPSQKSTDQIMSIVRPIVSSIRERGDAAVLEYTHKFEKATTLTSPVLNAPFPKELMQISEETKKAIDVSFSNIRKFHAAQASEPLKVETMPGVVCSRVAKPIERVGLYIPGGTAVLPSTSLMLGVPAQVAGCKTIVLASPPRKDGTLTPEVVYIAHLVGAQCIVLAGGAQAVAAMAYGTESVPKVDKILGPGNQFVTAAKMLVSNDTNAGVSIDMPAGPSEVLVVADETSNPAFVASDLLSQAEHGVDSQVILIAVALSDKQLAAIEDELHAQAAALPRVDVVRGAISHSVTLQVRDIDEAMKLSNSYAPEHLILQVKDPVKAYEQVENAGSVFIGEWTPESVGDYSAGTNHSLPTYGYAKQYSGVNLSSFQKHITSSHLTPEGLRNVGTAVMQLAKVEELEAHRRAVEIRLGWLDKQKK